MVELSKTIIGKNFDFIHHLSSFFPENAQMPRPMRAPTPVAAPKTPSVAIAPVAPRDWAIENALPATTFPIPACIPAATLPAATPLEVNPATDKAVAPVATVPAPIPAPVATLFATPFP